MQAREVDHVLCTEYTIQLRQDCVTTPHSQLVLATILQPMDLESNLSRSGSALGNTTCSQDYGYFVLYKFFSLSTSSVLETLIVWNSTLR